MKIVPVIPTIRNLDFLKNWRDGLRDCAGIIVKSHHKKELEPKK